jgi:D-glycero-D-manno-heptose 1,7-bisphosphate phosphatase
MKKSETRLRRAVFLDRDGTLIEDRGNLSHPSQVIFYDDTVPALQRLRERFELFLVTNQSGVAKGVISIEDVERVNTYVVGHLAESGVQIVSTYVCPHARIDNCRCIKPKPYFLRKAEKDHRIDLKRSYVIGDHPHDVEFGKNVDAGAIYLLSGHGIKHRDELDDDTVVIVDGIREAVEIILKNV